MLVTRLLGRGLAAKAGRVHILDRVLQIAVRPGALAQRCLAITMAVAASAAASTAATTAAFAISMRVLAGGSLARLIFFGRTGIVILMRDRVLGRGLVRELGGLRGTHLPPVMIAPAAPSPTPPAMARLAFALGRSARFLGLVVLRGLFLGLLDNLLLSVVL
jgi:hypothetical protein